MNERQTNSPRDAEIDRLLQETKLMLGHTRAFLAHLSRSEATSRDYIQEMEQMLELELDRLNRKKNDIKNGRDI